MKILIATDWFLPSLNGVVISVLNLRGELEKKGHEVIVLTLSQTNESHKNGGIWSVGAHDAGRVYPKARISFRSSDPIIDELIQWKPDVIHTQCEMSTFRFARKIAKATGAPIIHTYHTVYEYYIHYLKISPRAGRRIVSRISQRLLDETDHVIVPTVKTKRILEGYRVKQPMHIIPTGIDLERFETKPEEDRLKQLRDRYGISREERILVAAGRLAKEKNTEELIETLYGAYGTPEAKLPEGMGGLVLLIVGGGPYGEVLKKCVAECEKNYGKGRFRVVFTGEIAQGDMPLYYHMGDCFVSASVSETQGLTYIEALASGLPAICRKDECLEGVIVEGVNGYTFEDGEGLIRGIQLLFQQGDHYEVMSQNAVDSAEHYTVERFCENVEQVYYRAVGGK